MTLHQRKKTMVVLPTAWKYKISIASFNSYPPYYNTTLSVAGKSFSAFKEQTMRLSVILRIFCNRPAAGSPAIAKSNDMLRRCQKNHKVRLCWTLRDQLNVSSLHQPDQSRPNFLYLSFWARIFICHYLRPCSRCSFIIWLLLSTKLSRHSSHTSSGIFIHI